MKEHKERYLTTQEAADYLQLSPRTLQGYRVRGGGPTFYRRGRNTVRYTREDLDAWLKRQEEAVIQEWTG